MVDIQCEITSEGFVFKCNGKSVGPLNELEELSAVNIASQLGVSAKEVFDARLRTWQQEIEKDITWDYVVEILSITVKRDRPTKLIVFSAMLLARTENDQVNVGLQAESSSGKSYIPIEISEYFPEDEIVTIASASPTAFFHDRGRWDEDKQALIVDLESKILIFLDQPHFLLLERLRPLLSHDKKELIYKITDKNEKRGLRTKNVILRGFPAVIFCTVKMNPDEQEKTRLFLLSPGIDEEKLNESIKLVALRKCNPEAFNKLLETNVRRKLLKDRVTSIRNSNIKQVIIPDIEHVIERFKAKHQILKPRDQRDFPRIISLIKAHALLNYFTRKKVRNDTVEANQKDVEAGFLLYEEIAIPNELGLPPYVYDVYQKVFVPLFKLGKEGVNRKDIEEKYFLVYHKPLGDDFFRKYLVPALRSSGLITEEPDPDDKRKMLYYPTISPTISSGSKYSGEDSGVNNLASDKLYRCKTCGCGPWNAEFATRHLALETCKNHELEEIKGES